MAAVETSTVAQAQCDYVKEDTLASKFVLMSIFAPVISIFGVFGNICIITITVMQRSELSANRCYVAALCVSDCLILGTAILLYPVEHSAEFFKSEWLQKVWLAYLPATYALSHVAQSLSVFHMITGACERYLAVAFHKKYNHIFGSVRISIVWICVGAIASLSFCLPRFFELQIVAANCTGFGSSHPAPSTLLENEWYQTIYLLWLANLFLVLGPFIALAILNWLTIGHIRRRIRINQLRRRWIQYVSESISSKSNAQQKSAQPKARWRMVVSKVNDTAAPPADPAAKLATNTFIAFVSVFLVCNLWSFVLTALECSIGAEKLSRDVPRFSFYSFSREAVNFFAIVGPSANFPIYAKFNRNFRKKLKFMRNLKNYEAKAEEPEAVNLVAKQREKQRRRMSRMESLSDHNLNLDNEGLVRRFTDDSFIVPSYSPICRNLHQVVIEEPINEEEHNSPNHELNFTNNPMATYL